MNPYLQLVKVTNIFKALMTQKKYLIIIKNEDMNVKNNKKGGYAVEEIWMRIQICILRYVIPKLINFPLKAIIKDL